MYIVNMNKTYCLFFSTYLVCGLTLERKKKKERKKEKKANYSTFIILTVLVSSGVNVGVIDVDMLSGVRIDVGVGANVIIWNHC